MNKTLTILFLGMLLIGSVGFVYNIVEEEKMNNIKIQSSETGTVEISEDVKDFFNKYNHRNDFVYIIPEGYNKTHYSLYGELVELNG